MKILDAVKIEVVFAPVEEPLSTKNIGPYLFDTTHWFMYADKSGIFREVAAGTSIMLALPSGIAYVTTTTNVQAAASRPPVPVQVTFHFAEVQETASKGDPVIMPYADYGEQ